MTNLLKTLSPQHLARFVTFALLVAFILRLYQIWPQPLPWPNEPRVAVTALAAKPALDSKALEQLQLFRAPAAVSPFRVGNIALDDAKLREAPVSSLNARLTGVLSGPQGIAVVEHNQRQISLTPGEPLAGEAKLVRIFADRIIISRRGHYEALLLD